MAMGVKSNMVAGDVDGCVVCGVYRARGPQMRDSKRLKQIRTLKCCSCWRVPSQAAHSNFSEHGKGMGIKAGDEYTIPLCAECHRKFDTYSMGMDREQSKEWFEKVLKYVNEVLSGKDNQADF